MNLFNGADGNSDGTANGHSAEIKNLTGTRNIHVFGTFDGASVTLQRYSESQSAFVPTDLVWTEAAQFQGLYNALPQNYQLVISRAGTSTSIAAEVF